MGVMIPNKVARFIWPTVYKEKELKTNKCQCPLSPVKSKIHESSPKGTRNYNMKWETTNK